MSVTPIVAAALPLAAVVEVNGCEAKSRKWVWDG